MEERQNAPSAPIPTDVSDADEENKPLSIQQLLWIDYNAMNGLITDITETEVDEDGKSLTLRKMNITRFAELVDVHRDTLRRWRSDIPNFWERVNKRRVELAPQARLAKMHEVWYLSALKTGKNGFADRQLWLANFDPNFRMPAQKIEHELGDNWAALAKAKLKAGRKLIDAEPTNNPS